MRLVTYYADDKQLRPAVLRDGQVYDIGDTLAAPLDMNAFLAGGQALIERMAAAVESSAGAGARPVGEVTLGPPVPRPGKIICMAGNYPEHIAEAGWVTLPKDRMSPWMFVKPVTAINGPEQPVHIPQLTETVDWEVELAFVIGKRGRYIPAAQAYDYVAGYMVFNDVSGRTIPIPNRQDREWDQFHDWLHGKWFDTFACTGPALVLKDEVPDPLNLDFELRVNGKVQQAANTSHMIFTVADIVQFASKFMTLEPGDIFATGTGSGVGDVTQTYLRDGDVMEAEIKGLGILRNPVRKEPAGLRQG